MLNKPGMFGKIGRFWRTVRYLKPIQIYRRLWFSLYRPKPDSRPIFTLRARNGCWTHPARRLSSMIGPQSFCFLNESGTLGNGWDDPTKAKLWRYNLHYFDDLNSVCSDDRISWQVALIDRWVNENPIGTGTGWEPYPLSIRMVNWIKWALSGHELSRTATASLAAQARWLSRRLEWHILGNHLFTNAKALVFAGLYFDDPEAEGWLATGTDILLNQLPEQILADGAQFELSPMYHILAAEDLLDLINIASVYPIKALTLKQACADRLPNMLRWLNGMCHPDGEISFFNDAAFGIAPVPCEIRNYADRLGYSAKPLRRPLEYFKSSGYARLSRESAILLADVGAIGPDYLPGHAHADSLSFEFSLRGQRIFVNSGTSVYGISEERLRQRGTAAHNTVVIEGFDSSEVWSGFRVGRRARTQVLKLDDASLTACHDGYRFLPGAPLHTREWTLTPTSLKITDSLSTNLFGQARYHLHPSISVEQIQEGSGRIILEDGSILQWNAIGTTASLEKSSWHPEFGVSQSNLVLILPIINRSATLRLFWTN